MTDKRIGEILEKETFGIFDEREAGITGILNAIHICLKEESVSFFKWNATQVNEYLDYLRRVDRADGVSEKDIELDRFEGATIESRYKIFLEQQWAKERE